MGVSRMDSCPCCQVHVLLKDCHVAPVMQCNKLY